MIFRFKYISFLLLFVTWGNSQGNVEHSLDKYFNEVLQDFAAPGFSVSIVEKNRTIYSKGFGVDTYENKRPVSSSSPMAIGSLTKSLTALAILQLVEQGLLNLEDPVIKILPNFRLANKEESDKITVRMLLNNTSGIPGGVSTKFMHSQNPLRDFTESLSSIYMSKEAGTSYTYSNPAFSVAGLIISEVSGLSYSEYLQKNIFEPLEMYNTTNDPAQFDDLSVHYGNYPGIGRTYKARISSESLEMSPAGMVLRSSAKDIANYLIALMNDGKFAAKKILTGNSVQELWKENISFPGISEDKGGDGKKFKYGLGWMLSEVEGVPIIHHGGSRRTMSSMTIIDTTSELAATILTNVDYNFMDIYSYPPLFNILLNAFNVIQNKAQSDYGIPRETDPTLNDYEVDIETKNQCAGEYLLQGQFDAWDWGGSKLFVSNNSKGQLIGVIKRGKETIFEFCFDFLNEASAVSRNIASTKRIRLVKNYDGEITGMYIDHLYFKKIEKDFLAEHQLVQHTAFNSEFYISKDWVLEENDRTLVARHRFSSDLIMEAKLVSPERFQREAGLKGLLEDSEMDHTGLFFQESNGDLTWNQQFFSKEEENYFVCRVQNLEQNLVFVISGKRGNFTHHAHALLSQIRNTITFQ